MDKPTLFFIHLEGHVITGGFDEQPITTLLSGQDRACGIAVSPKTKRIYWSIMGIPTQCNGYIKSCNLNGSEVQRVLAPSAGLHNPKQITIDNESQKLYISDREGLRIVRCSLDYSFTETLIESSDKAKEDHMLDTMRWCTGVAIDPDRQHLYWSQQDPSEGHRSRICRAGLELPKGQKPGNHEDIEILCQGLPKVMHLEFDSRTTQLYWTDHGGVALDNNINRAYVGPDREEYL